MMKTGYVTVDDGFIYTSMHLPEGTPMAGVLMLPPMVEERKCAYRLLYELAELCCAELNLAVLRFDPRGTGESSGEHRDSCMASWLKDCRAVEQALREVCDGTVIGFGTRFGANVALRAAADLELAGLVLVEPLMSGEDVLRDMVRRKQIKEMMGGGKATSDEAGLEAAWEQGESVDVDGFEIGLGMFNSLKSLDLLEDLVGSTAEMPTLLCHVGGAKELTGKWATAGERLDDPSKALCIRQKPFWGNLDYQECAELKETVMDFLRMVVSAQESS